MNGITNKGKAWEWRKTWWLIGLAVILLGWISFVFMGIRTKTKKWMIEGVIYCVVLNLAFVFSGFDFLWLVYFAIAAAAWILSIIRVCLCRREYLMRLEVIESIEEQELMKRIRAEYEAGNGVYEPLPSRSIPTEPIVVEEPEPVYEPVVRPVEPIVVEEPEPVYEPIVEPVTRVDEPTESIVVTEPEPVYEPVTETPSEAESSAYVPNAAWQEPQGSLQEEMPFERRTDEDGAKGKAVAWLKGHKFIFPIVLLAAAIIIAVCVKVFDKDVLTFTQTYVSLYAGTSEKLTLQSKKGRAYSPDQLVYTTSDETVATVSTEGQVQGLVAGTATITCKTAKGRCEPATIDVTVKNDVLSFTETSALTLTAGDTKQLSVVSESGINYPTNQLSFTSSATGVATVDYQGNVKAVGEGYAKISVKKADGTSNIADIAVTVKLKPVSIKNGEMLVKPSGSRKAPLKMEVGTGKNYYIYFKNQSNSKNDFAFYVASGKSVRFNVPLGTYTVYYATGQTWYGKKQKFGSQTVMLKLNGDIKFYKTSRAYVGKSIKLYPVANGNLSSSIVGGSEFPE